MYAPEHHELAHIVQYQPGIRRLRRGTLLAILLGWIELALPTAAPDGWADGYAFGEDQARDLGASAGVAEVWEDSDIAVGTLESRGWVRRRARPPTSLGYVPRICK